MRRDRLIAARKASGHTQESLAQVLNVDRTTVGTWERGEVIPHPDIRPEYAKAMEVSLAELDGMLGMKANTTSDMPHWLSAYLGMERSATRIEGHQTRVVHGLLQTPDYARVIAGARLVPPSDAYVARTVALRAQRQERLQRPGDRLPLTVVQSEAALRLKIGNAQTMAEQLTRMAELASLSNVTVRVIPFEVGMYEGIRGPFTLLTMPWQDIPAINIEGYGTSRFAEEPHEVEYFLGVWKQLLELAWPPDRSVEFIQDLATEWESRI